MIRLIREDLRLQIKGYRFWLSAFLCIVVAALNLIENATYSRTLFDQDGLLIFLHATLLKRNLFLYFAPLIAALPFSTIPLEEIKHGFARQQISRTGTKSYFASRIISAFLIGAFTVVAGLLMVLCLAIIFAKSGVHHYATLNVGSPFSSVYKQFPIAYLAIFLVCSGVFGGVSSVLSAGISLSTRSFYIGFLCPVLLYGLGTLAMGRLWTLDILPFSTFAISTTTIPRLLRDQLSVFFVGIFLMLWSFWKWRKEACSWA